MKWFDDYLLEILLIAAILLALSVPGRDGCTVGPLTFGGTPTEGR